MRERVNSPLTDAEPDAPPIAPPAVRVLETQRVGGCLVCRGALLEERQLAAGPGLVFAIAHLVRCSCNAQSATR